MTAAEDEDQSVVQLTAEETASLAESLAQADRGEFATDEQVRAIWAKHGLLQATESPKKPSS
jgi:predicted transcriptional regulator